MALPCIVFNTSWPLERGNAVARFISSGTFCSFVLIVGLLWDKHHNPSKQILHLLQGKASTEYFQGSFAKPQSLIFHFPVSVSHWLLRCLYSWAQCFSTKAVSRSDLHNTDLRWGVRSGIGSDLRQEIVQPPFFSVASIRGLVGNFIVEEFLSLTISYPFSSQGSQKMIVHFGSHR